MNSDNSALGGVTLDYGPFAFMERYEPYYNPWVGGGRPYSYGMQMEAAATNLGSVAAGGSTPPAPAVSASCSTRAMSTAVTPGRPTVLATAVAAASVPPMMNPARISVRRSRIS